MEFDVSKVFVMLQKIAEDVVGAFKEVHDRIDGIYVTMNASFYRLKDDICNILTYFLCH